jgi:hypothetical protein
MKISLQNFDAKVPGYFECVCRNQDGSIAWKERLENGFTNVGLQHMLETEYAAGTQVTSWKIGLISNASFTSISAGDTISSHAGWIEFTGYSQATRPSWSCSASGGTIQNSSAAVFTINTGSAAIRGAFLCSDSTKGGTTGTLASHGQFSSVQSPSSGQTLEFRYVKTITP